MDTLTRAGSRGHVASRGVELSRSVTRGRGILSVALPGAGPLCRFPIARGAFLLLSALLLPCALCSGQSFYFQVTDSELLYDRDSGIGSAVVSIVADQTDGAIPIQAFAMGVFHDGPIWITSVRESPPLLANGTDFFDGSVSNNDFTIGCVLSFQGTNPIIFNAPTPLVDVTYSTSPFAFVQLQTEQIEVSFSNSLGSPPVENVVVGASSETFAPSLLPGIVVVRVAEEFLRGDANNDGSVNGLIDGVFILNYGLAGGPAPSCLAAADVNDDGVVLAINDGIYLLSYEFLGGAAPAAPGPLICGPQPGLYLNLPCASSTCP